MRQRPTPPDQRVVDPEMNPATASRSGNPWIDYIVDMVEYLADRQDEQ